MVLGEGKDGEDGPHGEVPVASGLRRTSRRTLGPGL